MTRPRGASPNPYHLCPDQHILFYHIAMLMPLDPEKFRTLARDDDNELCREGGTAKSLFAKDDFAGGMKNLLQVFDSWVPYVYHGKKDFKNWHIQFQGPPFDALFLRPSGGTIEIFKHNKFLISFGILGRPQNWARMLQWIWAYGDKVYETNVKKGSILRPLDYSKLDALIEEDNDADCDSIRRTKACLGKEKDLARGIMCLFEGWEVFTPCIHRDKEAENTWEVTFRNSPFRSLRIKPSTDHGVVDLYAFDRYLDSWQVLNNPKTGNRQMWQRLPEVCLGGGETAPRTQAAMGRKATPFPPKNCQLSVQKQVFGETFAAQGLANSRLQSAT